MPPDPYERLQAARTAVKALKDERAMLALRLAELAKGSDEEALVEASMRLDVLPIELLRAELKLARADRQAARATLQAAEASLARALANVRDVEPLPDATVTEKLERAAEGGNFAAGMNAVNFAERHEEQVMISESDDLRESDAVMAGRFDTADFADGSERAF